MSNILENSTQFETVTGREDALALTYIGDEILKTHKKVRVDSKTVILVKIQGSYFLPFFNAHFVAFCAVLFSVIIVFNTLI